MQTLAAPFEKLLGSMAVVLVLTGSGPTQEPKPRSTLDGAAAEIRYLAFSPDGKTLVSASESSTLPQVGEVMVWDLATGKGKVLLAKPKLSDYLIAFSPDGALATGGADGVRIWDLATQKEKVTLKGQKASSLAFSPDGKTLATGGMKETGRGEDAVIRTDQVKLWDAESGKHKADLEEGQLGGVVTIAFSPDGKTLASSVLSFSPGVVLWDVGTGKRRVALTGKKFVACLAYRPDGKSVAAGYEDGAIKLWDATAGKLQTTLTGHAGWVNSIQFSPDGRTLASAGADSTVRLWDVEAGKETAIIRGHKKEVTAVTFSPDGRLLASAGKEKVVLLWDMPLGDKKDR